MRKNEKSEVTSIPAQPGPDIAAFMQRIEQKLIFLEKKMDLLIGQGQPRPSHANPPAPAPLHRHHDLRHGHGQASAKVPESKPAFSPAVSQQELRQVPKEVPAAPVQGPSHGHSQGRRERILHKTVCADCQKDCEVPFKPTGERPVYCKECFSKRKSGRLNKGPAESLPVVLTPQAIIEAPAPVAVERKVTVTKKGVGKVTVTEIARPSAREAAPKGKPQRSAPVKKSKR